MSSSDDDDFMLWQILRKRRLRRRSAEFAAVWLKEVPGGTANIDGPPFEVAKNDAIVNGERRETWTDDDSQNIDAGDVRIKSELSDTDDRASMAFAGYDTDLSLPEVKEEYLVELLSDPESDPRETCDHGCSRGDCLTCLSVNLGERWCSSPAGRSSDHSEGTVSLVHPKPTEAGRRLECAQCGKEFSHRGALVLHLRSHGVMNRRQADVERGVVNRSQLMTLLRQRRHRARMTAEQRLLMRQKNAERQRRRRAKMNTRQAAGTAQTRDEPQPGAHSADSR